MDLGTTIVGIIITIICIIPFALISISRKKKEKKLLQELTEFAEKNNCKISRYELWNSSTIGIDDTSLMIFYKKKSEEINISQQVTLSEIQKCRVSNSSRTVSNKNGNYTVVEKLGIGFLYHDKNKNEVVLEFYNADYDSLTLTGELQLAEKWCNLFNEKISEIAKQKK
ncbi:MAG: hypothetical protein IT235_00755 [Bacteroidia bacterium]|nr:hypothetical protein [Bacteroidia bacterium]